MHLWCSWRNKKICFAALENLMYATRDSCDRGSEREHTIWATSLPQNLCKCCIPHIDTLLHSLSPFLLSFDLNRQHQTNTTVFCKTYSIFWIKLLSVFLSICHFVRANLKLHICHRYLCMRCECYAIVLRCQYNVMQRELQCSSTLLFFLILCKFWTNWKCRVWTSSYVSQANFIDANINNKLKFPFYSIFCALSLCVYLCMCVCVFISSCPHFHTDSLTERVLFMSSF